jgi:selenocysteine-specific elongation factor
MIIGTAGHIDHGKTALTRALTGVDTDRLKEEKARGISIDLGYAYLPAPDGTILGFVDVPGHEKFIHNMLAGATGIDFVLLVVAADDGVMPQTREHLAIIDLLGVRNAIVALTKVDLVSSERRHEAAAEIAAVVASTALAGAEIVAVSPVSAEGVDTLRQKLFDAAQAYGARSAGGRFRLAVDRSFSLSGAGTVVTGTVLSGSVAVDDRVTISPHELPARVRSIHAQNRAAPRGVAGERCALNLAGDGISKDAVVRGDVVLDAGLHAPTDRIDATLRVLASEHRPIAQWLPVRLHHAAVELGARVVLLGEPIAPGGEDRVQLVLERPIAAAAGDRFVLRDTSAQRTIGGGMFLDLRAPVRRRRTPERLAQLDALAQPDLQASVKALLAMPPFHLDLDAFARDHALGSAQCEALSQGQVLVPAGDTRLMFAPEGWTRLKASIAAALKAFHAGNPAAPGMTPEALRRQIEPRLTARVFPFIVQALAKAGDATLTGAAVGLPGYAAQLAPADEKAWKRIAPLISDAARFRPPRVNEIAQQIGVAEADARRLMKLAGRMHLVSEIAPDHFFLRDTVAEMVEIAADVAGKSPNGEFGAAAFRDRLDNGRKVAIQILEFFDRHGITMRRGDLRRINPQKLGLFVRSAAAPEGAAVDNGRESSPVGRPDFKSGRGRQPVFGGFDSHSLPPRRSR